MAQALIGEIHDVTPLAHRVLSQTERRVFHGETVHVHASVLACNLLVVARHMLAAHAQV